MSAKYKHVGLNGEHRALHRVRAERALGRPLPEGVVVHHADRNGLSLDGPLVICQDQAYHQLLHARMRIKEAGGNPNTDAICMVCRQAKSRELFVRQKPRVFGVGRACRECTRELNRRCIESKRAYKLRRRADPEKNAQDNARRREIAAQNRKSA